MSNIPLVAAELSKKSHKPDAGRIVGIILAILLILVIAWAVWKYLCCCGLCCDGGSLRNRDDEELGRIPRAPTPQPTPTVEQPRPPLSGPE